MTSPAQIIYCADLTAMLARATDLNAAGAQLDAANNASGDGTYQPEIIAYTPSGIVILRLHAMAEDTHHLRRTSAYNVAAAIIAAAIAQAEVEAEVEAIAQAVAQAIAQAEVEAVAPDAIADDNAIAPLQTPKR